MHFLNFLVAIILPYITLFSKLAPPEAVPGYFFSEEAAFVAGEFYAVVFYWAGFLRNFIRARGWTDRRYFFVASAVLLFIGVSKIIFALPYTWITSIFAFGLGVLSVTPGQSVRRIPLALVVMASLVILSFSTFILIGMAWRGFTPTDYYYYRNLFVDWF